MIKIQSNEEHFNEIDFNTIKEKLTRWREKRNLSIEGQKENFKVNYSKELTEFFEAERDNNEYEMIDAVCDMIVVAINAGIDEFEFNLYEALMIDIHSSKLTNTLLEPVTTGRIIGLFLFIRQKGYDPCRCLLETIKEINSRTGSWNKKEGKWCKDKGAYTLRQASGYFFISYLYKEDKDYWYFLTFTGRKKIKKWYKADYSKYYIGD